MINGFVYNTSSGLIEATYFTSMPECYKLASTWDVKTSSAWYNALAYALNGIPGNNDPNKTPNITVEYLWNNRNKSVPKSGAIAWPLAVSAALSTFIGPEKGSALANWLCGGYLYKGVFGISSKAYDAEDFIDAENCYSYYDPKIRISDCLIDLKKANVAAHDWVVRAASAKFANKVAHELTMYNKSINAQTKAVANVAESAAKVVGDVGTGLVKTVEGAGRAAGDALGLGAWLLSNIVWVAPVALIGAVYISWKMKGTIAKVAVGGPAALLLNKRNQEK